jgi:hypothetical protein
MLQKDENAYVRSSMDAARFVQGVVSFQSTAEHLSLLDDDRTWHQSVSEYGITTKHLGGLMNVSSHPMMPRIKASPNMCG